jgi:thiamine biosynthesis lipoprotein
MKTITFQAMGSKILIAMDTDDLLLMDEALKAREWFEQWEESLSRFRLTSELSQLNRRPGMPIKVSDTFFKVASLAKKVEKRTHGLISPSILNALESAGYTETFENLINQTEIVLKQTLYPAGNENKQYELDEINHTITIPYGIQLDFGGFAKGWAAHQTMLRLQGFAPVLVDAGGDIAISAQLTNGSPWPVGVVDPMHKDNNLELLMLVKGGIATSGRDYRRWFANNAWQHHLIDTRTNKPAETDVLTATVIAENVMEAESSAKMGLILGSKDGTQWLKKQPNLDYLLVLENGIILKSNGFLEKQWSLQWNQLAHNLSM